MIFNEANAQEIGASLDESIAKDSNATTIATTETAKSVVNEAARPEQGLMSFLPLIIIFVVFYFFIIRPQSKKQKEQQKMIEALKKGDKVILSSGIVATIFKIEDNAEYVQVEIAENVKVKVLRQSVLNIINLESKPEVKAESKKKDEQEDKK